MYPIPVILNMSHYMSIRKANEYYFPRAVMVIFYSKYLEIFFRTGGLTSD